MISVRTKGMSKSLQALRRSPLVTGKSFGDGIVKAGLLLQRESQKVVPVDTGNLKGSAFTRTKGKGYKTEGIVGYTANYAIYVHENLEARHKPGKIAKYLERPFRENWRRMIEVIRMRARQGR